MELQTGIAQAQTIGGARQQQIDLNATRFLFNPFDVIDLRNGYPTGHSFLDNGKFIAIDTIYRYVSNAMAKRSGKADGNDNGHNKGLYTTEARYAAHIAGELLDRYSTKGVVEVKVTKENAARIAQSVLGESIPVEFDPNNPDHPCPVIPAWLERIHKNVKNAPRNEDWDTVVRVAEEVKKALNTALNYCQQVTNTAKATLLDAKAVNRSFSPHDIRCFIASGEEIPNELPFLTKSQNQGQDVEAKVAAAFEKMFTTIAEKANAPTAVAPEEPSFGEKMAAARAAKKAEREAAAIEAQLS